MPIYEYRCPKCDHLFEKRVTFDEGSRDQVCPVCGHARTTKLVSLFARLAGGPVGQAAATAPACGPVG